MKNGIINRVLMSMASMALVIAAVAQNSTCFFLVHQDKVPEAAKKLRRF